MSSEQVVILACQLTKPSCKHRSVVCCHFFIPVGCQLRSVFNLVQLIIKIVAYPFRYWNWSLLTTHLYKLLAVNIWLIFELTYINSRRFFLHFFTVLKNFLIAILILLKSRRIAAWKLNFLLKINQHFVHIYCIFYLCVDHKCLFIWLRQKWFSDYNIFKQKQELPSTRQTLTWRKGQSGHF